MVNSKDFSRRMEKIMDVYGLTASAFAEKIDVGRSSISHILSGRNKPSLEFVMKVIETFPDVELYWLLNGKGSFPVEEDLKPVQSSAVPGLFDEDQQIQKETEKPKEPNSNSKSQPFQNDNPDREISRIVIFYTDGTFENFTSNS